MKTTDPQDEIFYVVNENDEVVGKTTRKDANSNPNIIHRAAGVLIFNEKGEVLVQKRSKTKDVDPDKWTYSMGGHVLYGDEYLPTAIREMKEELGIDITEKDLEYLGKVHSKTSWEQEILAVYKYVLPQNYQLTLEKKEVVETKFYSIGELQKNVEADENQWAMCAVTIFRKFLFKR